MKVNDYGAVFVSIDELIEGIYANKLKTLDNVYTDHAEVDKFNLAKNLNKDSIEQLKQYVDPDISVEAFDKQNQEHWFMPDEYKNMDIEGYLVHVCPKENYQRLVEEIQLFKKHGMINLLRYMKYLVDTMRKNNVVWGVGRGSSVASYALYLLGIHKIDSIKYKLDIHEFLKENPNGS